jgi:hypothetical protein
VEESGSPDVWAAFPHDPRDPAAAPLRASDADREVVRSLLADAFADGRIDREEYDERSGAALGARTLGELPPLVADLVPDRPLLPTRAPLAVASASDIERRAVEHWRDERRNALFGFLGPTLICWTIFVATNASHLIGPFPWPLIVMAATFVNFLRVATSRREVVAAEVRRLEKKRAKEIEARQKKRSQGPDAAP